MQEIEAEPLDPEPRQAARAGPLHVLAAGVVRIDFRDDEDLLAATVDGLAHDLLRAALPVHLGGVDERHPEVEPRAQRRDLVGAPLDALAHPPGPLPQRRHRRPVRQHHGAHVGHVALPRRSKPARTPGDAPAAGRCRQSALSTETTRNVCISSPSSLIETYSPIWSTWSPRRKAASSSSSRVGS